ncbi:MAG: penicillin-binding protein activator LpoB [Elusimicrobiota bacterium]
MKKSMALLMTLGLFILVTGCGKKVERIGMDEQRDLSGKWNDTDSRMVSETMIEDCLSRPWLEQYREKEGEQPTVIVGAVLNRTDEHVVSQTFTKDLERAFINSGQVQVVASADERKEIRQEREEMQEHASEETLKEFMQEKGADFMLKGTINSIRDKEGGEEVIFYQINLELVNTETNQKVWIGDKKIRKYIKS